MRLCSTAPIRNAVFTDTHSKQMILFPVLSKVERIVYKKIQYDLTWDARKPVIPLFLRNTGESSVMHLI